MAKTRSKYVVKSRFGQLLAWKIRLNASCVWRSFSSVVPRLSVAMLANLANKGLLYYSHCTGTLEIVLGLVPDVDL